MQLAAQLAAKAAEARRKEAQSIKPMIQAGPHLACLCSFHASDRLYGGTHPDIDMKLA